MAAIHSEAIVLMQAGNALRERELPPKFGRRASEYKYNNLKQPDERFPKSNFPLRVQARASEGKIVRWLLARNWRSAWL